jgi:twinkle protein
LNAVQDNIDYAKYMHPIDARAVISASTIADRTLARIANRQNPKGGTLPFTKTHNLFRFRPREVSVWAGPNGHGKSALLNQVTLSLMEQGERVFIASLEMPIEATMDRFCQQGSGTQFPLKPYVDSFHQWTNDKLWLYDRIGREQQEKLLAVLRYVVDVHKVQHVVIDSLMRVVAGTDDYNSQKDFVTKLCVMAMDWNCHAHLVAHARKAENEKVRMDKWGVKGASEITDQCDNLFLLWRNKEKEGELDKPPAVQDVALLNEPDTFLTVSKQRHGDWEGQVGLWYDPTTKTFRPSSLTIPALLPLAELEGQDAVPF